MAGVTFDQYEALVDARGEGRVPRMTFLRGTLYVMSPSRQHEYISRMFDKLLTAYAEERGIPLTAFGAWTLKGDDRGAEPDECYILGETEASVPDLAIEVVWTSAAVDKLDVYRGLGVPEVWVWRDDHVEVHALVGQRFEREQRSRLLPDLDLDLLARHLRRPDQMAAIKEFRAAIRSPDSP